MGGPISLLSQGTGVMGSSEVQVAGHTVGCQGLIQGSRQELARAALPIPLQQGYAARGGWQRLPTWEGGLGRAGASTPTRIRAWACMDRPGGRVWTDLSGFALSTAVFILRGLVPPAENCMFHVEAGHSGGSPKALRAGGPAQLVSGRRKGLLSITVGWVW